MITEQGLTKWQRKTLTLLLEKYERSRTWLGTNRVEQRFCIASALVFPEYESDYADMDEVSDFEQQEIELERRGLIACEWDGREISRLCANADQFDEYCRLLGRTGKKELQERLLEIYGRYEASSLLEEFGQEQCARIRAGKKPQFEAEKAENILKLCLFLEENENDILERELSIAILGDTKLWETRYRSTVCRLIRNTGRYETLLKGIEEKREWESMLLEEFCVFANPAYVWVKGNAEFKLKGGKTIPIYEGMPEAISYEVLEKTVAIHVQEPEIMTVENLTSFHRIQRPGTFFLFLSGYHSSMKTRLLLMIAALNQNEKWLHFGDIDPDGLDIAERLRRSTGIPFTLYRMGIRELEQYQAYTKPLNQNDRTKARTLLENEAYAETAAYMLAHDCKLEQEIISWKQSR